MKRRVHSSVGDPSRKASDLEALRDQSGRRGEFAGRIAGMPAGGRGGVSQALLKTHRIPLPDLRCRLAIRVTQVSRLTPGVRGYFPRNLPVSHCPRFLEMALCSGICAGRQWKVDGFDKGSDIRRAGRRGAWRMPTELVSASEEGFWMCVCAGWRAKRRIRSREPRSDSRASSPAFEA
jgi:hypothetical protein